VGGKGNEGVSGVIKQTEGAIGYTEFAYAIEAKLTYATLKNQAGEFVAPSVDSTTAAANAAADRLKQDVRVSIVNGASKDAYPIVGFTYVLLSTQPKDATKAKALSDFIDWVLTDGQKISADLQYGPLPQSVQDLNAQAMKTIAMPSK
jgi:phosphate transport system substrate-binding protein